MLSLKKGFKVYNHECYTFFLKEVMKESVKGDEFDEIRKVRNKVNYYGQEITPDKSLEMIEKIRNVRNDVLKMIKSTK